MSKISLSKYIEEEIDKLNKLSDEELDEISTSAGAGPYDAPGAFRGNPDDNTAKGGIGKHEVKTESTFKKMTDTLYELSYQEYKKDETLTPKQKINEAIRQVNRKLWEIERILNQNLKFKTEMNLTESHYWKSTFQRFSKINERISILMNGITELTKNIKKEEEDSKPLNEGNVPKGYSNLQKAKDTAKMLSKEESCVQHVNQMRNDYYVIEDWYDADKTIASYENGRQL